MAATRVQTIGLRRSVGAPSSILQVLMTPAAVASKHAAWQQADLASSEGCERRIAQARRELKKIKFEQMLYNFHKYRETGPAWRNLERYDSGVRNILLYLVQRRRIIVRIQQFGRKAIVRAGIIRLRDRSGQGRNGDRCSDCCFVTRLHNG